MSLDPKPSALIPLIVADIFELAGRFRAQGEAIAGAVGQTQARWQVISAASADPRTVPQIARRLGVTRQNVQRIADLLVAEGSAKFEPNPDHRGSPYLLLTQNGRTALAQITKTAAEHHARLARKLAGSDVRNMHQALRQLIVALAETDSPT